MDGVWLLPTYNRLPNLRRFMIAAREMGTGTPGWILVNKSEWAERQAEYEALKPLLVQNWTFKVVDADTYGGAIRAVWNEVKDFKWIGLVADDLIPSSSIWDQQLIRELKGWNVVSSNDGWQASENIMLGRLHGAIVWSGPLARAVGWIFPEGFDHIFHDNVWESLGRESGCWQTKMSVLCKHAHEALQGIRGPTMDPESALWKHDQAAFETWVATEKDACVHRIVQCMEANGVKKMTPDYTGMMIMIASPVIDGKYESTFVQSLYKTMQLFAAQKVTVAWAEEKYTADIALARCNLFSAFLRSQCTHLLMIDADMGWDEGAIMRLVAAKKDFVAVAGPKKRYPLSFAANYTDDLGNPLPLVFDKESGTMEVGEIGMAFCLITRSCAEKMVEAYKELEFSGATGETGWGVFIPMVVKGRWYSEDFAFCKRWTMLGEHCYFIPDVALSHTGFHTFVGSFREVMMEQAERDAQLTKLEAAD